MHSDVQRKLTTILAADAEGYSREMEADEVRALGALRTARAVFSRLIERHQGRIANTAGDGLIADFPSVVEAVQCAIEVQNELESRAGNQDAVLRFRIGIHLGDVIVDGSDLLGEGVNLAARLQSMAEPGGILISQQVYDQVHSKLSIGFEYLGEQRPKNYAQDVAVYRIAQGRPEGWLAGVASAGAGVWRAPARNLTEITRLRREVGRQARLLAALGAGLLAVDLATGPHFWVQWPALAMVLFVAWKIAPVFVRPGLSLRAARSVVLAFGLLAANLFSWSGYPWALWPIGVLAAAEIIRRLRGREG